MSKLKANSNTTVQSKGSIDRCPTEVLGCTDYSNTEGSDRLTDCLTRIGGVF
jgi:hypothetical protein